MQMAPIFLKHHKTEPTLPCRNAGFILYQNEQRTTYKNTPFRFLSHGAMRAATECMNGHHKHENSNNLLNLLPTNRVLPDSFCHS